MKAICFGCLQSCFVVVENLRWWWWGVGGAEKSEPVSIPLILGLLLCLLCPFFVQLCTKRIMNKHSCKWCLRETRSQT